MEENINNQFFDSSGLIAKNYQKWLVKIGYKQNMTKKDKELFLEKWEQDFQTKHPEFGFPCVECKVPNPGGRSWCYECYIYSNTQNTNKKMIENYDHMDEYEFWLKYF